MIAFARPCFAEILAGAMEQFVETAAPISPFQESQLRFLIAATVKV